MRESAALDISVAIFMGGLLICMLGGGVLQIHSYASGRPLTEEFITNNYFECFEKEASQ